MSDNKDLDLFLWGDEQSDTLPDENNEDEISAEPVMSTDWVLTASPDESSSLETEGITSNTTNDIISGTEGITSDIAVNQSELNTTVPDINISDDDTAVSASSTTASDGNTPEVAIPDVIPDANFIDNLDNTPLDDTSSDSMQSDDYLDDTLPADSSSDSMQSESYSSDTSTPETDTKVSEPNSTLFQPEMKDSALSSDEEIDLFGKFTFRDKRWWNKYKVLVTICAIFVLIAIIAEGIVLFQWFMTGRITDTLGTDIRDTVTLASSITESTAPTVIKDFDGNEVEIVLPDNVVPIEDAFPILEIDFTELRKTYPNAIAWLVVPGVGIEYPVAQADDNEYYLTHAIDGTISRAGWVFADYRENLSVIQRNTVIYGHNMADGTIFGKLKHTMYEDWWSDPDNQFIYLVSDTYSAVYQVYNIFQVKSTEVHYARYDLDNATMVDYLEEMSKLNLLEDQLNYASRYTENDNVITLSTCADANGYEKYVVQGILIYSRVIEAPTTTQPD